MGVDISPLRTLADSQHGVVTRDQARRLGVTNRVWYRLHDIGILNRMHKGVSVFAGFPPTRWQRMVAATASAGEHSLISHRSAGELWGIWNANDEDPVEIIVGDRRWRPELPGVIAHVPRDLDELSPTRRMNMRTTVPGRTLLDIAAVEPVATQRVIERMLMAGLLDRRRISAIVALHSRQGRAGIGPVREVLASWPYAEKASESVLEYHLQGILGSTTLPRFETQVEVGPYRLDFGWPRWKVGAETDGWGKFESRADFRRMAERDAYLQSKGWSIAHFLWRDIVRRPGYVVGTVRSLLVAHGWTPDS
jgi:very-short-patch-repair endonuclease